MNAPQSKAPGAGELTGRKLATAYYAGLSLLANFFGAIFRTSTAAANSRIASTTTGASGGHGHEVITAHPIVEFVRRRGHELKRAGRTRNHHCPITHHKRGHRPVIYPKTQSWSCHDCKIGGTVIDWVMHEKNVTAAEAMRELAGGLTGRAGRKVH